MLQCADINHAYDYLKSDSEQIGVSMVFSSKNMRYAKQAGEDFLKKRINSSDEAGKVLRKRSHFEKHYYTHLLTGIFSQIGEQKYATKDFEFEKSRRIVYTNKDCISFIQVIIRDEITVIVQMRSSDYSGALPLDLNFFSSIPYDLYRFIEDNKGEDLWDEVTEEFKQKYSKKKCNYVINFGSLH